jgi:SAM-dependent methyltransferase
MTTDVREDIAYKTADHEFRSRDEYAQGKYDLTTRWLRPHVRAGQLLLNIGCGGGEYNATAHALGLRVVACEPEETAYALAKRDEPPGVRVFHCGLGELAAAAQIEPAQWLVMHDVLEHIEDDRAAVAAVHDLLEPGGTAIISVPAYQWLFGEHDVKLGHYRRYTRRSLVEVLGERLEIEATRYYGAALIPVAWWSSRWRKQPYPVATASRGLGAAIFRAACQFESRVPLPAGISVIARARRRR